MTRFILQRIRDVLGCLESEPFQPVNSDVLTEEWACSGLHGVSEFSMDIMSFLESGVYDLDLVSTPSQSGDESHGDGGLLLEGIVNYGDTQFDKNMDKSDQSRTSSRCRKILRVSGVTRDPKGVRGGLHPRFLRIDGCHGIRRVAGEEGEAFDKVGKVRRGYVMGKMSRRCSS